MLGGLGPLPKWVGANAVEAAHVAPLRSPSRHPFSRQNVGAITHPLGCSPQYKRVPPNLVWSQLIPAKTLPPPPPIHPRDGLRDAIQEAQDGGGRRLGLPVPPHTAEDEEGGLRLVDQISTPEMPPTQKGGGDGANLDAGEA
ncbi:hypothetical protein GUJ93_ZPchr0662g2874 [Zizania palustris]|uniref:Uncharacterized protein n=1 Tax=Zizania palustris TaxID=103762 RepID=A0A8J5UWI5_ZIZPA|nr:hypothetical protein GUJ93_ZPchr0662g2874 [Zizania palustris]